MAEVLDDMGRPINRKGPQPVPDFSNDPNAPFAIDQSAKFGALGDQAFQMGQRSTSNVTNNLAPEVRAAETMRKGLSGPGALESRYASALGGTDLAGQRERDLGARQINQQYGAMGGGRSGAALQATANMDANIVAKNQARLDDLAGGAQNAQQGRYQQVFGGVRDVSRDVAGARERGDAVSNAGLLSGKAAVIQGNIDALTGKSRMDADANKAANGGDAGDAASSALGTAGGTALGTAFGGPVGGAVGGAVGGPLANALYGRLKKLF